MKNTIKFLEKNNIEKVSEFRTCRWTWKEFPIFEKDIEILEKLSPVINWKKQLISLPTLSPKARQIRRLLFRNEWNFYKSRSSKTWEAIISLYAPENNAKVFEQKEWWQDDWDPMDNWFEVDLSKNLNSQFTKLRLEIPRLNMITVDNWDNCEYTTWTGYCENCYLINSSENSRNCYYWKLMQTCEDCVDCSYVYNSQLLYQCLNVKKAYKCTYLHNSSDCDNCHYSDDLIWCSNCMFSSNLRNKKYYFKNEKLNKEEYEEKIKKYLNSRNNINNAIKIFEEEVIKNKKRKYSSIVNSSNSYWNILIDNKDCFECYDVADSKDCRYTNVWVETKDLMDTNNMYLKPERSYEVLGTIWTNNVHFSTYIFNSNNILYSQDCFDCNNLFWCVWLRNKEYCIFNKQYDKKDYEEKVEEIIEYMRETWEWWEYFDTTNSAFPYNDSLNLEYFPVKEVVLLKNNKIYSRKVVNDNWNWVVYVLESDKEISKAKLDLGWDEKIDIFWKTKEKEIWIPENIYFMETKDLKDNISEESEDIFKKAIKCSSSWRPFRITPAEFKFYKRMNLPIPEHHSNERYYKRLWYKAKRELNTHNCIKCNKETLSVYDKNTDIYCEGCYNEVVN